MRVVKPSENGPGGAQGLEELKHVENVKKEVQEDGLRIIKDTEDSKDKHAEDLVRPQVEIHRPQPQPQPNVVRWERFLPIRSLKVMLVEYDDSTRHVVSALLRNCSYEVTAVPNGVEAWKILEDLNNQIDLVLTEVVMPGLSGIGLLSKMMSHKSRQNIPVIMMSSHDSMGVVLKCLSKGAVDFLVKPIRKNELKNLWQHIWRKCHSSSGSGSESGVRTEKSIGAQSAEESDNDSGSDDEDDTRSVGLQVRDGSDNGSGTQSSWTKRAAEVESPQPMSPGNQLDPPDSTCAQVIYPTEAFASSWVTVPMKEHIGPANLPEDVSMGKEEIAIPRNSDSQLKEPSKKMAIGTSTEKNQISQSDLKKDGRKFETGKVEISNENSKGEWIKQTANLTGDIASNDEHHRGSVGSKIPTAVSTIAQKKYQVMENVKDLPSLELSLKSLGDDAKALTDVQEQNILRRSQLSAFTRYVTGSTANQGQTGNVGSCSPLGDSSEAVKQSNSECNRPNQNSNSSSNNSDMGSTNKGSSRKPATATDKVPAKSTVNCSYPSSAFQSAETGHVSNPQLMVSVKPSSGPSKVVPSKENYMFQEVHIQHHHHRHHHHDHHVYSVQKLDHDDLSLKNISQTAPQCGSSNAGRVVNETNAAVAADCSVYGNGNACGSNHGSNMHNGSSAVVDAEGMNLVNGNGVAANDGICKRSGSGSGSGVGVDQSCSAQREAALNKFRQKRKERCFEKRVRYQSRKKLAEQRPRIRGQFVRQARETKGEDADS